MRTNRREEDDAKSGMSPNSSIPSQLPLFGPIEQPTVIASGESRCWNCSVGSVQAVFCVSDARSLPLPDASADLVLGSPPYLECRTYGIGAQRKLSVWIEFMLACTREALRVSKGLVLWVAAGQTKQGCYIPGPEALMHEGFKAGIELWRPCCWHKVDEDGGGTGIPGSGRQWLRGDWEYVIAFKRPGPLHFADPTFQKIPPKFPPGGAIRNRQASGRRDLRNFRNPSYVNPGNVLRARVGGHHMGDAECHETEAPFPERLAAFFIEGYVPVGGVVVDPFSGSGTTVCEAVRLGRGGFGFDIRASQVELACRRLSRRIAEKRGVPK